MADVNYRPPGGGATGPTGPKGDTGDTGPAGADGADGARGQGFRDGQTIFNGPLIATVGSALTSGTAYFSYIGYFDTAVTINYIRATVTANGSGAQTAEMGLFSTTTGPDDSTKSFVKIAATGSINSVITGTALRLVTNTSALNQSISAGTHLWAGIRTACATSQPSVAMAGVQSHIMQGKTAQLTAASGALTGAGPFAGAASTSTLPVLSVST